MKQWVSKFWNSYKYRFVPWISYNMKFKKLQSEISKNTMNINSNNKHEELSIATKKGSNKKQSVEVNYVSKTADKIITNKELKNILLDIFKRLSYDMKSNYSVADIHQKNCDIFYDHFGFLIGRRKSNVSSDAGTGVYIVAGTAKKGSLVGLYPGTIYMPYEPLFFPSLGNCFIFRCGDGVHIDGNDRWISKSIYKSCASRDQFDFDIPCCDTSWLSPHPMNPLTIGQYVNNQSRHQSNNVVYQECRLFIGDIHHHRRNDANQEYFPVKYARFMPNVWSNPEHSRHCSLRIVPLVAVEDIQQNRELLSSYFTVIHE